MRDTEFYRESKASLDVKGNGIGSNLRAAYSCQSVLAMPGAILSRGRGGTLVLSSLDFSIWGFLPSVNKLIMWLLW